MMKQILLLSGVVLVLLLLQVTLLPMFLPITVRPDLLLIFTVSCGLLFGHEKAVGMGFFVGLVQDLAAGNLFGLHVLSKMTIGYFAGLAEQKVFKEHIILPMAAMLLASVLNSMLMLAFLTAFGYPVDWSIVAAGEVIPSLIGNVLFSVSVHQTIYRLAKRWD